MRHNTENLLSPGYVHKPVLWREIVEYVASSSFRENSVLVDSTCGEGGHSEILLKTFPGLTIIAFERDAEILEVAKKRLAPYGDRVRFVGDNFSEVANYFDEGEDRVNFFLYDFGISSYHFDKSGRGFAFKDDEPLDMRLTANQRIDARYVVNKYREKELNDIIYTYGEERWAKRIAAVICERREKRPIETTGELASIVLGAIPRKFHVKNIHPATRVFQALRIEVNNELEAIEKALCRSYKYLTPGGRIMAISFHSLEDRIVKNTFRQLARGCTCGNDPKYCMCREKPFVKIITRKPVVPGDDEIRENPRARSSKLRVCEKTE